MNIKNPAMPNWVGLVKKSVYLPDEQNSDRKIGVKEENCFEATPPKVGSLLRSERFSASHTRQLTRLAKATILLPSRQVIAMSALAAPKTGK